MGWYFWGRGDYDRTIASCQRALALAETLGEAPSGSCRSMSWATPTMPWATIIEP